MNKEYYNFSKSVIITNELGLHARAAAKIAKLAMQAEEIIWIIKDSEKVDASSIIDILTLGCSKGTIITFTTDNESDLNILNDIVMLVEKGFGE
ncbi:MAG: HPr family phosphocarrier protein [Proteobacteria bacterium]|nr:HPr family phosphocarrier protein [Pseudomonadota bacterium]MBU1712377.1 HPr family phosphocarrier protein [Pseudomonadota bacterium]